MEQVEHSFCISISKLTLLKESGSNAWSDRVSLRSPFVCVESVLLSLDSSPISIITGAAIEKHRSWGAGHDSYGSLSSEILFILEYFILLTL